MSKSLTSTTCPRSKPLIASPSARGARASSTSSVRGGCATKNTVLRYCVAHGPGGSAWLGSASS
eukprot:575846-Pyramimonas_sp.AAC.1